jgi:acetyl-CoA carboxylase carboxyl transferase subunit beta
MPIKLPSFRPRRDAYPPDLWTKCPSCGEMLFNKQLDKVLRVCPSCGHHFRLSAEARLALLLDGGSFVERDGGLQSEDPLGFVDQKTYPDRIAAAQLATGMRDAAVWGTGTIDGQAIAICVMDFGFMGGSMGAVVGEKVTRAAEHALVARVPLVIVSASGGARMQEGTLALMQLAKTVGALERLRIAGVPFISILTDPTTGGVFASFAVLGDVNVAEPNALIGFAGARVSAGTIAQELPPGFQRSEFLYLHGFLDRVVHRTELRAEIANLLGFLVARPMPVAADETVGDALGLPSFRPLSFLSNLADRVMQPEPDLRAPSNGNGTEAAGADPSRTATPRRAPRRADTAENDEIDEIEPAGVIEPAADMPPAVQPEPGGSVAEATESEPIPEAAERTAAGAGGLAAAVEERPTTEEAPRG